MAVGTRRERENQRSNGIAHYLTLVLQILSIKGISLASTRVAYRIGGFYLIWITVRNSYLLRLFAIDGYWPSQCFLMFVNFLPCNDDMNVQLSEPNCASPVGGVSLFLCTSFDGWQRGNLPRGRLSWNEKPVVSRSSRFSNVSIFFK